MNFVKFCQRYIIVFMKQCPICKTTYTDDTLAFCLADGGNLTALATSEQKTQQFPSMSEELTQQIRAANNPIRVNIAQNTSPAFETSPNVQPPPPPKKGGSGIIIGLLVALLALVILGSAGVIGWLLLKDSGKTEVVTNQTPMQNSNASALANSNVKDKTPTPEKTVQPPKNARDSVPTLANSTPQNTKVTAKANSPGDGFLALRSAPSTETGERILQIPHGATLTVLGCQPAAAGKKGRWCRVDYDGNVGWAFDGFMIYQK